MTGHEMIKATILQENTINHKEMLIFRNRNMIGYLSI
jgi:hypothetical protein